MHGKTMYDFRRAVQYIVSDTYLVKVTATVLNVRKDAGTNNPIVTTIKLNEVYTIVEEKMVNGVMWGKLKSQVGWICLDYTTRFMT